MSEIEKAIRVLQDALKTDPGYRITWQANIAMAFQDAHNNAPKDESIHRISNRAANNFLELLCAQGEP